MGSVFDWLKKTVFFEPKTARNAYYIQLGFDFGTSYSKCVFRDLEKEKAYVFTFDLGGRKEFLISSTIICENKKFSINKENEQYPTNGLWHIKVALADLSQRNFKSPTLSRINKVFGLVPGSKEQEAFVKAACLLYLSRTLQFIRKGIFKQYYEDFGKNSQDDMYVTMAIPVSNLTDTATEDTFFEILKKAWVIACQPEPLPDTASCQEMEIAFAQTSVESDESCHVYPEVSANIQPFSMSPQSPGDSSRIYFVTDVGSGTVDQCCFTLTNRKQIGERINYFSAQVFELGSGVIERRCEKESNQGGIEYWRQQKEKNSIINNNILNTIIRELANELEKKIRSATFSQLKSSLKIDNKNNNNPKYIIPITTEDSIRRLVYIFFTGGGNMENPYQKSVLDALELEFKSPIIDGTKITTTWDQRVISITIPEDIVLPEGCVDWMRRLYVSYGLSFKYENLPHNKYP